MCCNVEIRHCEVCLKDKREEECAVWQQEWNTSTLNCTSKYVCLDCYTEEKTKDGVES